MLDWADSEAKSQSDREHVTTIMRTYPSWGTYGVVLPYENRETKKLSVDTEEDLARVRAEVNSIDQAQMVAEQLFGRTRVHRY
jgi:spore coat polysaccharide biosynthesis protein SpsF (cytidylyltransferase family)